MCIHWACVGVCLVLIAILLQNRLGKNLREEESIMSTPSSPPPTPGGAPGAGYFVDQKKGEVNELKSVTRNLLLLSTIPNTLLDSF
jgi:hypothetical protein